MKYPSKFKCTQASLAERQIYCLKFGINKRIKIFRVIVFIRLYLQFIAQQQFQVGTQDMNTTFSPFFSDMQECRQSMRKLRKKIYKNCRNNHYPTKKLKDITEEITQIFQKRNIPPFITEALRKRRNFDLKSIKNILVTSSIPLQEIRNRTYLQQKQVENIFSQHKKRLQELKKKQEENRVLGEVMYQLSTDNIYSSTNEDQYIRSIQAQMIENSQSGSQQGVNILFDDASHQEREFICHKDYFDFNINESSIHQDLAFLNF